MVKNGKRYVVAVYAEDVNIKRMFSVRGYNASYAEIVADPSGYWESRKKGYKYNVKSLIEKYLLYNNGALSKLKFVGAFHKKRDALNYISDYCKDSYGTGGVVVNRNYQKNVTIRTYYNVGKMLRIFYLVDMDVDDGVLHEEIIYRTW